MEQSAIASPPLVHQVSHFLYVLPLLQLFTILALVLPSSLQSKYQIPYLLHPLRPLPSNRFWW